MSPHTAGNPEPRTSRELSEAPTAYLWTTWHTGPCGTEVEIATLPRRVVHPAYFLSPTTEAMRPTVTQMAAATSRPRNIPPTIEPVTMEMIP